MQYSQQIIELNFKQLNQINQPKLQKSNQQILQKSRTSIYLGFLPTFAGIIAIVTILSAYFLAYKEGHVGKWPATDITHCLIKYPEYMIGRIGLISASFLMVPVWYVVGWFLAVWSVNIEQTEGVSIPVNQKRIVKIGAISAFLLMLSTAAISDGPSDMNWTVHIIGASGFFIVVLYLMLSILIQIENMWNVKPGFISENSFKLKMFTKNAIYVLAISLILSLLAKVSPEISQLLPKEFGNILEWVATGVVMVGLISFSLDFNKVKLKITQ